MATILPFAIRPGHKPRSRPSSEKAVVVIFPGIRHEPGMAGTVPTAQRSGTPGRRKKST